MTANANAKKPSNAKRKVSSKPAAKASAKPAAKAARKPAKAVSASKGTKRTPSKRAAAKAVIKAVKGEKKLKILVRKCPHKPDSVRETKWGALRNGQTVKQARAAIREKVPGRSSANYLRWLEGTGKVKFV
jgi:predicted DNA-binding transcriptional regulator YafY